MLSRYLDIDIDGFAVSKQAVIESGLPSVESVVMSASYINGQATTLCLESRVLSSFGDIMYR